MPDALTAWRLVRPKYGNQADAFGGEGSRLFGGRWNSPGVRVIYVSSSLSLAVLETLVHADRRRFEREYIAFKLRIPEALMLELRDEDLPEDWQARAVSEGARRVGDAWLKAQASVALSVPSVIVPEERNYLLNPEHPQFAGLIIEDPRPFRFDARLADKER